MTAEEPRSLRRVVRARRNARCRLRLAPGGPRAVLAPVAWVLVMVFAVVLAGLGLAVSVLAVTGPFMAASWREALVSVLALPFVSLPVVLFGAALIYGAANLAKDAVRFARAFRWIEIRATRIVVAGWFRRTVVEIVDLSGVMVRDDNFPVDLVLRVGDRVIVCPSPRGSRQPRVDPLELTARLGEALAQAEVPVRHCRAANAGLFMAYDSPLHESRVATIWQVPVEDVAALADRFRVRRTENGMFNTYDVEWWTERVRAITIERDSG